MRIHKTIVFFFYVSVVICFGCMQNSNSPANDNRTGENKQSLVIESVKDTLHYLLYLPKEYDSDKTRTFPLIFFLHGSGERGNDLELLKKHGIPYEIEQGKEIPFIVVAPQCSADEYGIPIHQLNTLYEKILSTYRVNVKHIYLTGMSMGGASTLKWASENPEAFAAIAPVCAFGDPFQISRSLQNTPVWFFHGAKDDIVPHKYALLIANELKEKSNNNVQVTIYPEVDHFAWVPAYKSDSLYHWFLKHEKQ